MQTQLDGHLGVNGQNVGLSIEENVAEPEFVNGTVWEDVLEDPLEIMEIVKLRDQNYNSLNVKNVIPLDTSTLKVLD